mmetsp:Transcript_9069/g.15489  ORF Transcript_9069/g.15489 Transcript_9069/m.15489 type:complete len:104 (-) Transcript_9069:13-324(-)
MSFATVVRWWQELQESSTTVAAYIQERLPSVQSMVHLSAWEKYKARISSSSSSSSTPSSSSGSPSHSSSSSSSSTPFPVSRSNPPSASSSPTSSPTHRLPLFD